MTPISYSLAGAAEATGLTVDALRKAIREDRLPARYHGEKPLITHESLTAFVASLPTERTSNRALARKP